MNWICLSAILSGLFPALLGDSVRLDSVSISRQDSIWKEVKIDNVYIEGSQIIHYPNKDVWNITDDMRQNTIDTYDILEKLPGLYVDKVEKTISYKGRENVLIIVDGKQKDMSYIGNLHNKRFKQIEVYEHSHERYTNADVVINIITKERWSGFDFSENAYTRLLPSTRYGSAINTVRDGVYYTYTKPKFDFSTSFMFNHQNKKYSEHTRYLLSNDIFFETIDDGKPNASSHSNAFEWWADFDYKINDKNSVSAKYCYKEGDYNQHAHILCSLNEVQTERTTRNDDGNRQHTFTLYYRGKSKTWSVYSDIGLDLYDDDVFYLLNDNTGFSTSYILHNKRKVLSASVSLTKRLRGYNSLNMGMSGFYREYSNERKDDFSKLNNESSYLCGYVSYSYMINKKCSGSIGLILTRYDNKAGDEKINQLSIAGAASIKYIIDKATDLEIRLSSSSFVPGYEQVLPLVTRMDSMIYNSGNSSVKTATEYNLSTIFNKKLFYAIGTLQYSGNKLSTIYNWEHDYVNHISQNVNNIHWEVLCGFGPFRTRDRRFSFRTSLCRAGGKTSFKELNNNYSYWRSVSDVSYNSITWGIQFQYSSQPRFLPMVQGESKSPSDKWQLTAWKYFLKRRLLLRFSYQLPIKWGIGKNYYQCISTPYYSYNRSVNVYNDYKNSFYITIRYLIAKGHQVNKVLNSQDNKGVVNEISH